MINVNGQLWSILLLGFVLHSVPQQYFDKTVRAFSSLRPLAQATLLFFSALLIKTLAVSEAVPFIYFQF